MGETNGVSANGGDTPRDHHVTDPHTTVSHDGDVSMADVSMEAAEKPDSDPTADSKEAEKTDLESKGEPKIEAVSEATKATETTKATKATETSNETKTSEVVESSSEDVVEPPAKRQKVVDETEPVESEKPSETETKTSSDTVSEKTATNGSSEVKATESAVTEAVVETASSADSAKPAESTETADSAKPTETADSAKPTESTESTESASSADSAKPDEPSAEAPVSATSTPAKTPKSGSKNSAKKDGKISTFFAATPTKNGDKGKETKTETKSGDKTAPSATPSKTATPKTGTPKTKSTPSSTPLKLRLKTKPQLPALEEDHDEENPNPNQIEEDSDAIANHPDIAFCVMFRTRFSALFDGWCPPLSPQEFEEGILPEEGFSLAVESYLVRVMSLMMNRKKPVEVGKYSNALETWSTMPLAQGSVSVIDAMSLPCGWSRKLASRDVVAMDWRGRLQLLKMATVAALALSDAIKKLIADKREVSGRKVLSELQWSPLGEDRARNTYWLVDGSGDINWDENEKIIPASEGAFDTQWRLYRQSNPYKAVVSWLPVASSPEELATLIEEMPELAKTDVGKSYTPLLQDQHTQLLAKLEELIPRSISSRERIREAQERAVAQQAKKAAAARAHEYQKSKIGTNRGRTRGKRVDYKQLAAPQDSEDEFELKEEEAIAQGRRRTGRTRNPVQENVYDEGEGEEEFEATPSPEPEEKPETPRNAEGKKIRYVEKQGGGRRGKGWVYVVEEEIEEQE
ncbi:hypothetical protein CJU90_4072 [Yarrowia sp. C11]|nr:hypothetical protein CKK34_5682 [Yarrowia sp. E02]KAG5367766.1 hypothetical protein CJU90_4072 [Yarrowia sp. C11]